MSRVDRIRESLPIMRSAANVPAGSPFFIPQCPQPDCGVKNWPDARTCSECGTALYPSPAVLEAAKQ